MCWGSRIYRFSSLVFLCSFVYLTPAHGCPGTRANSDDSCWGVLGNDGRVPLTFSVETLQDILDFDEEGSTDSHFATHVENMLQVLRENPGVSLTYTIPTRSGSCNPIFSNGKEYSFDTWGRCIDVKGRLGRAFATLVDEAESVRIGRPIGSITMHAEVFRLVESGGLEHANMIPPETDLEFAAKIASSDTLLSSQKMSDLLSLVTSAVTSESYSVPSVLSTGEVIFDPQGRTPFEGKYFDVSPGDETSHFLSINFSDDLIGEAEFADTWAKMYKAGYVAKIAGDQKEKLPELLDQIEKLNLFRIEDSGQDYISLSGSPAPENFDAINLMLVLGYSWGQIDSSLDILNNWDELIDPEYQLLELLSQ